MEDQIVKLNVGGVKYWTTRTTLTKPDGGNTFFSALLRYGFIADFMGVFGCKNGNAILCYVDYKEHNECSNEKYL